jgi:hypothetical protein
VWFRLAGNQGAALNERIGLFATVENKPPLDNRNSALSGTDRHDFAVSQGLDIANWGD